MTQQAIPGPAWIPTFLAALAETGKPGRAREATGISLSALYTQRRNNLAFAEAWQARLPPKVPRKPAGVRSVSWRVCFLEALAETSNVTASALRANVPVTTVYRVKRCDAAFAAGWLAALHEGYDQLEMELLGYLRDPQPQRKMDVTAALRLLAAHRETVERRRALMEDEDEQAVLESIDRFLDEMCERRAANTAILEELEQDKGGQDDGTE